MGHITFIYVDEASFNLSIMRRRGKSIIGQKANVTAPVMVVTETPFLRYLIRYLTALSSLGRQKQDNQNLNSVSTDAIGSVGQEPNTIFISKTIYRMGTGPHSIYIKQTGC
ncbi:hypothetical protein N1851_023200 [Merluccius polli]|uniref:Uncharacterized protein n=1 Tax=Merluccius polli TaxID=89951 RepID=A0AA47MGV7_MERPO|nr:hypothetical protein N1851_023200 [Merluccius polli]